MTRTFLLSTIVSFLTLNFSINVFAESEYTVGASYHFSGSNSFSNASTFDLGATLSGSMLVDESHEYGMALTYNVNWEENEQGQVLSEASTFMPQIFYRHHFFLTDESSRFPTIFYLGPSVGYVKTQTPSYSNNLSFSLGFSGGLQIFLARDIALDLVLFDANRIVKNNRTLLNQSLGVRFYF